MVREMDVKRYDDSHIIFCYWTLYAVQQEDYRWIYMYTCQPYSMPPYAAQGDLLVTLRIAQPNAEVRRASVSRSLGVGIGHDEAEVIERISED